MRILQVNITKKLKKDYMLIYTIKIVKIKLLVKIIFKVNFETVYVYMFLDKNRNKNNTSTFEN